MKHTILRTGVLFLALAALGCGDTPQALFRDVITSRNELADVMVRVSDEESAQPYIKSKVDKIKKKWDHIKERAEKQFKDSSEDENLQKQLAQVTIDMLDEMVATDMRIWEQVNRLTEIRYQLFVTEMEERQKRSGLPNCIDDLAWSMFSTRFITPSEPKLYNYQKIISDEMGKLLTSGGQPPEIWMIVTDRQELIGPRVIFVDTLRYRYYLAHLSDKTLRKPLSWTIRAPGYLSSGTVTQQFSDQMRRYEEKKISQKPVESDIYQQNFDAIYQEGENVQWDVNSKTWIIVGNPDPKWNIRPTANRPVFFDPGMAERTYAQPNFLGKEPTIDTKSLWPSLTFMIEAPTSFDFNTVWRENPFVSLPNQGGAGGDPMMGMPAP
jgi:hypothetical protein